MDNVIDQIMREHFPSLFEEVVDKPKPVRITRANVDELLDARRIETRMSNGNWWTIRRNGATKTWKKDANRIRIPYKMGLSSFGAITETDFRTVVDGIEELHPDFYRVKRS